MPQGILKIPVERVCPECKKTFVTDKPQGKFCSEECISANEGKRYRKPPKTYAEKICVFCKKPFIPAAHNQIFCTPNCCYEAQKLKFKPQLQTREAKCLWCHSLYKTFYPTSLFCFHECRYQYGKMKKRIANQCPFEHEKQREELERLKMLGQNYVLPARTE